MYQVLNDSEVLVLPDKGGFHTAAVLIVSTRSGLSLFVYKAMLPRILISIDAMLCTASASHAHAPGLPQRPTYLPLGCTLSLLVSTNNAGDAHNA